MQKRLASLLPLAIVLAIVLGVVWSFFPAPRDDRSFQAAIGGPFTLVDGTGATVTERDFLGRYMLVFFGYTYCPDVCPTMIATLSDALEILGPEVAEGIVPVFISVDPERDTPKAVAEYAANFHPRFVGLTGSADQIAATAKVFRVHYAKSQRPDDSADTYFIDHTAIAYLMGPDGRFLRHFTYGLDAGGVAQRIREAMEQGR